MKLKSQEKFTKPGKGIKKAAASYLRHPFEKIMLFYAILLMNKIVYT